MRIVTRLTAFGSALLFASSAIAATVISEQGQILLNRGDGYRLVTQPTEAAAGAQLIVNPQGAGRVVFADGCAVKVEPGSVFTIAAQSPCEVHGAQVETGGSLKDIPPPEETRERSYVVPALIGGGLAIGAVLLLQGKDHAASP